MSTVNEPRSEDPTITARPETSLSARPAVPNGTAPIKAEYLINPTSTVDQASTADLNGLSADDIAEGATAPSSSGHRDGRDDRDNRDDNNKRRKPNKKERKGQNKARHFPIIREAAIRLCKQWETTGTCSRGEGNCKFGHSWDGYFELKPADIPFNLTPEYKDDALPYVIQKEREVGGEDPVGRTIDLSTSCPVYKDLGYCPFGWRCRFLGGHVRRIMDGEEDVKKDGEGPVTKMGGWELLNFSTDDAQGNGVWKAGETNRPEFDLIAKLKRNEYDFPFSRAYLSLVEPEKPLTLGRPNSTKPGPKNKANAHKRKADAADEEAAFNEEDALNEAEALNDQIPTEEKGYVVGESEVLDVPLRPEEKKRLNWEGGRYLAPLTTVGNLPFRRLCVDYGATITISEMALAQPLVSGHIDEWALCRRHESEKMFGIQLAGGFANRMVPAAELIKKTIGEGVDFVDINMGCPIDLVFNQGAGSALMDAPGRLAKILVGMNRALGDIPLTVKFRTGIANNKPNAHKLIPKFATQWGAGALTIHGRSRQQRYSKLADWDYIKTCATTLRESLSDAGLPPVPIFGNGDCFSAQSYYEEMEKSGVDGVMVARGALIKPWIFTEIKERREWDISATERLEGIRKFAEFGLSHWGSDTQGINTTRRFLCEALSFQHRYIPIGLLEVLPPKLNERPPAFRGRSELETLLSSPFAGDWVKISEMFLGKVDEGFNFVPKHKSNAYGGEEAQG
ncbi:tRNA-dihydrouridine(47) synthase [NAD(P)(+)] [Kwoniella heveanensis BCC8398]|uniref:tRNA-dihydrouridine(47) synthase [NAD(P)(+)] n=1 Tax=Kwoniella heveanensis BCC8398 TaxID=1296120 RepID=A0A1B9GKE7_9TREE|nr:tRNA-dihydrouridine(47) synthase [NAD(P)(+)] [Kwoniella heveanensis BCC8398]